MLVDEFQDTNSIQYNWARLIAGIDGAPFVVGDDDQSIYRWRGAKVENLRQFTRDFPSAAMYRLEQNYRSTGNILSAANAVISNNSGRLGKNLWTSGGKGEPIRLFAAYNERDEADFVLTRIQDWVRLGGARREVAVLYRSNAQSRVFEEVFLSARVPYRSTAACGSSSAPRSRTRSPTCASSRTATTTRRSSASSTCPRAASARRRSTTCARAHAQPDSRCGRRRRELRRAPVAGRGAAALIGFLGLVDRLARETEGLPLHEIIDHVIQNTGLIEHFRKDKQDRGEARLENLEELVSAARSFDADGEAGSSPPAPGETLVTDEPLPPLEAFLAHAVLESGEGQADAWEDCIQMMTLHTAKGLEFPVVFLAGLEDGLFPHQRSLDDLEGLEEERRLCYVGTTRAMKQLYLTHAESRRLHGMDSYGIPSRFIDEIPKELIEEVRPKVRLSRPMPGATFRRVTEEPVMPGMKLGTRVRHAKFGDGVVLNIEGQGPQARVQVNFEAAGSKWLMLSYANLEVV